MSSFKNAKKSLQRTHRERSQPEKRKQFGLLEKHKDYVLRAKDYHRKEDHLKLLREKARNKNPDEFYYKMINTKIRNGIHVVEKRKPFTQAQMKMMKSQDLNYTRMKRITEKKKIERLRCSLHLIGEQQNSEVNSHVVFVDSKNDAGATDPKVMDQNEKIENGEIKGKVHVKLEKARKRAYDELAKRIERERHLAKVEQQMQLQKHLMGKGRRKKLKGEENGPVIYKWKKQRKK